MDKYVLSTFYIDDNIIYSIQEQVYSYFKLKYNHPIVVPFGTIKILFQTIYEKRHVMIGDIYTRYKIPLIRNDMDTWINKTVQMIISNIENENKIIKNNMKLSIWDSI